MRLSPGPRLHPVRGSRRNPRHRAEVPTPSGSGPRSSPNRVSTGSTSGRPAPKNPSTDIAHIWVKSIPRRQHLQAADHQDCDRRGREGCGPGTAPSPASRVSPSRRCSRSPATTTTRSTRTRPSSTSPTSRATSRRAGTTASPRSPTSPTRATSSPTARPPRSSPSTRSAATSTGSSRSLVTPTRPPAPPPVRST